MQIFGGNGPPAGVSSANRLFTASETFDPDEIGSLASQQTYVWQSGSVTLTTANESGMIALQNADQERLLLIRYINVGIGESANTPIEALVKLYASANAITGTLISSGTNTPGYSRNLAVSTQPVANMYPGAEGRTITNGTVIQTEMMSDQKWYQLPGAGLVLPYNAAIAMSIDPGAGNTSVACTITIVGLFMLTSEAIVG